MFCSDSDDAAAGSSSRGSEAERERGGEGNNPFALLLLFTFRTTSEQIDGHPLVRSGSRGFVSLHPPPVPYNIPSRSCLFFFWRGFAAQKIKHNKDT